MNRDNQEQEKKFAEGMEIENKFEGQLGNELENVEWKSNIRSTGKILSATVK